MDWDKIVHGDGKPFAMVSIPQSEFDGLGLQPATVVG